MKNLKDTLNMHGSHPNRWINLTINEITEAINYHCRSSIFLMRANCALTHPWVIIIISIIILRRKQNNDITHLIRYAIQLVKKAIFFIKKKQKNKRAKMALYCSPDYQTSLSQLAFRFKRRSSILIFKMATIRMILATFDLQVTLILPMKFESITLLVQKKKFKIDFQHGC